MESICEMEYADDAGKFRYWNLPDFEDYVINRDFKYPEYAEPGRRDNWNYLVLHLRNSWLKMMYKTLYNFKKCVNK